MTAGDEASSGADDRARFDAFVRAESPTLLRLAWGLTGDRGAAEDLVQTALTHVWLRWSRIRNKEQAGAYTRKVIVSTFLTSRRRLWWGERATASTPESAVTDEVDALVSRADVAAALSALPARQRAVVVLRFLDDLSEAETADLLGCSRGTVKSHTARAVAALRESPGPLELWAVPVDGGKND